MLSQISATALLDPDVVNDPYPFYDLLRDRAPVWQVPNTDVFIVTSFSLLTEAARRVQDFSSNLFFLLYRDENGLPARLSYGSESLQALSTVDPPLHTLHKQAVFPEFVGRRMIELEPEVIEIADELVDQALALGQIDFMARIGNLLPITVISRLVGFRDTSLERLLQGAFDSTDIMGATAPLEGLNEFIERSAELSTWIAEQIATHPGGDDMLTAIGAGVRGGTFTAEEARIIVHTMLSAGGESTTSLLGNAVRILAERPVVQAQVRKNPELLESFIEEALRYEAPFRCHMRFVPAETSLGGVSIPSGSTVLLMWGAANRDPSQFVNPNDVVLGRTRRHVTFGRGIHTCIGAPLARLEARILLSILLDRTRWISLAEDKSPSWTPSLLVRRHNYLPVHLEAA